MDAPIIRVVERSLEETLKRSNNVAIINPPKNDLQIDLKVKVFIENYLGEQLKEEEHHDLYEKITEELTDAIHRGGEEQVISMLEKKNGDVIGYLSRRLSDALEGMMYIKAFQKGFDPVVFENLLMFAIKISDPEFLIKQSKTPGEKLIDLLDEVFINPQPKAEPPQPVLDDVASVTGSVMGSTFTTGPFSIGSSVAPTKGQQHFDIITQKNYVFDGSRWIPTSPSNWAGPR